MQETLIAALPWYDFEDTESWLDTLWWKVNNILSEDTGKCFSKNLQRRVGLPELWRSKNTVLCQCCGPDLYTPAGSELVVIGRPIFSELSCAPGEYYSYIVSKSGFDLRDGLRVAVNSVSSWSGYFALIQWLYEHQLDFSGINLTGSHKQSLEAIRSGGSELAAIDACSFRHLDQSGIEVIDRTTTSLTPPFVHHQDVNVPTDVIANALEQAISRSRVPGIFTGIVDTAREDYENTPARVSLDR